ncbi:MAG: ATP-dependent RecD-like DNA helicase [Chlamydiae bacterium]|nr:ATP-dependent RecD-like DNA helicase [Chlamydiota bacterium]
METLVGYIENIVFTESETGFTVARFRIPSQKDLTTVVGNLPSVQPGETLRCVGKWKSHPQHGRQFEINSFETQAPSDVLGIRKYLESGMIKGIGPVYAERIVKTFGVDSLKIIDENPEKLCEVPGLGDKRIDKITSCWQEQKAIRNVMVFLRGHGVSAAYAQKIYKAYGDNSIVKVRENPYALAKEIFGIGFKIADGIARGMGIDNISPLRIDAGIEHFLWELSNEGHTCFPESDLTAQAAELLQAPSDLIAERIEALVKNGTLMRNEDLIWVKPFYLAELGIARELARIMQSPCRLRDVHTEKALEWAQQKLNIQLAEEQVEAVSQGLRKKALIITGGPGTGKSTITKAILRVSEKISSNILLAAPTGRAAKRMTEITHKKAFTIHSLLEMDFGTGKFKRNKDNPLKCDLILVDESSMIDTLLMYNLLKAIPSEARVIFIGDIDQLPSVGAGNVLKDMIASQRLPVSCLKKIFRQAAHSKIIVNAHRVNQGQFPDTFPSPRSDFIFIEKETPEEILETIVEHVSESIPKKYRFHRFEEIQVLSPMKKGVIGGENLNNVLQQKMNPNPNPLIRMGRSFHVNDKVMQIRNNYQKEVFNGDVGRIMEIDLSEQSMKVSFDGKLVPYEFHELDELVLAYAVSIHKYQGSECPCIIIPIHTSHFKLLNRNLLYTGITRGKKLVILIGTKKALAIAVRNEEVKKRHTGLKDRIEEILQTELNK